MVFFLTLNKIVDLLCQINLKISIKLRDAAFQYI